MGDETMNNDKAFEALAALTAFVNDQPQVDGRVAKALNLLTDLLLEKVA